MMGAHAGSASQITQVRKPDPQLPFEVRIIAVNDSVWTGKGDETKVRFRLWRVRNLASGIATDNDAYRSTVTQK
ncbi:MAG TPA: hypothetical protein VLM42_02900 [Bryobacteraceae bacterium]|nr:hypothetical protein [Bryobacteraceae bacterium]